MQKLTTAGKGNYTVKWVLASPEEESVLKDICIEVGKEIKVVSKTLFGGMIIRTEAGLFAADNDLLYGVSV